ncbi:MAG: PD40 domain-containing protein [Verrucomicrobiales bacterium]|nr:PD40 domain-containing protein [Verrucomicrobiales bacterium]
MKRRTFISFATSSTCAVLTACRTASLPSKGRHMERLFFTSGGKTYLIHADGTGLRPLQLERPLQVTWQPAGFLKDGRVLMLSMEARRDGPGKPFDEYYHQTPTHVWAYDLDRDLLTELATKDRLAPFYTPQLMLDKGRILMQVIRQRPGQILNMNLDGTDAREFTGIDEGLPYGLSLSPDGQRVAFHLASPAGYQIWTSDTLGGNRVRVAAQPGHLYFGPSWSPDGQWLVYQDCHAPSDPGHDWSDVCVGRPDGSEHHVITQGQAMWFAATYGRPGNRGGGSNVPAWTSEGKVLFPRRSPGARVPWEYQAQRPDTDHYNREFRPETAVGGTSLYQLDPHHGTAEALTPAVAGSWDFRGTPSPSGRLVAFCRATTGEVPGLWLMNRDGTFPRLLTRGPTDQGVDHPRWLPS